MRYYRWCCVKSIFTAHHVYTLFSNLQQWRWDFKLLSIKSALGHLAAGPFFLIPKGLFKKKKKEIMKYQLKGLHLNQPIFSAVKFQNGIRKAKTGTYWHFVWQRNGGKKFCAGRRLYQSLGPMDVERMDENQPLCDFWVLISATSTGTWWGTWWLTWGLSQETTF